MKNQILRKLQAKNSILLIILALSMYSCITSKSLVSFEVLQPAIFTYPESVNSVGYLNRSARSFDSFSGIIKDSLDNTDLYILDTIYCNAIMDGLKEGKANSTLPYLNELMYLEARPGDTLNRKGQIPAEKVNGICANFGLDAIISQDYYDIEYDNYAWYSVTGSFKELRVALIQDVGWTVYIPGRERPLYNWNFHDTLYFVIKTASQGTIKKHTPLSILKEGGKDVGYSFGRRNVPIWNEISRVVYTGHDKELRPATKYTNKGDWENAKLIWQQNLAAEDKRLAAKCAHNLAVYHELGDNVDSALHYASQAREAFSLPEIEFYIQELSIRTQNRGDLRKQLRVGD